MAFKLNLAFQDKSDFTMRGEDRVFQTKNENIRRYKNDIIYFHNTKWKANMYVYYIGKGGDVLLEGTSIRTINALSDVFLNWSFCTSRTGKRQKCD